MPVSAAFASAQALFGGAKPRIDPNNVQATINRHIARKAAPVAVANVAVRLAASARLASARQQNTVRATGCSALRTVRACTAPPRYMPDVAGRITQFEQALSAARTPAPTTALPQANVSLLSPIASARVTAPEFEWPLASVALVQAAVRSITNAEKARQEPGPTAIEQHSAPRAMATKAGRDIARFLGIDTCRPNENKPLRKM
jgi:hypothetical protein